MGNKTPKSGFSSLLYKLRTLRGIIYQEQKRQERLEEMKKRYPNVSFSLGAQVKGTCSFGGSVALSTNVKVTDCHIGANTYIAYNSRLFNCDVGHYCSIGPETLAGLGMHPSRTFVSTHPSFFSPQNTSPISHVSEQRFLESKRIKIGNDVWIGARATIIDGVTIGDGAIVAAGAVVSQDVEPYSMVGGVPAKEIRKRFTEDEITFLLKVRWWEKDDEWIRSKAYLFTDIKNLIEYLS